MQRYLIQFNYFGSRFQGLQKQLFRRKIEGMTEAEVQTMYEKDERTVQGALESAVWNIVKPSNPVKLVTSSRTDKGVHALLNTAHVDLCPSSSTGKYFPPTEITKMVNLWMIKKDLDIRVRKTMAVPPTFHSRYDVARRSYLYRLAIVPQELGQRRQIIMGTSKTLSKRKQAILRKQETRRDPPFLSPLEEGRYCELRNRQGEAFDIELFKEALSVMKGVHNFSNFSKMSGHFRYFVVDGKRVEIPKTPDQMTKEITKIEVFSQPPPLPPCIFPNYGVSGAHFLDVVIEGRSFLHNQIRRMVGAAICVANGKVPLEKVVELLNDPEVGWDSKFFICPPSGLYLANIEYKEGALDQACESLHEMSDLEKVNIISSHSEDSTNNLCDTQEALNFC